MGAKREGGRLSLWRWLDGLIHANRRMIERQVVPPMAEGFHRSMIVGPNLEATAQMAGLTEWGKKERDDDRLR